VLKRVHTFFIRTYESKAANLFHFYADNRS